MMGLEVFDGVFRRTSIEMFELVKETGEKVGIISLHRGCPRTRRGKDWLKDQNYPFYRVVIQYRGASEIAVDNHIAEVALLNSSLVLDSTFSTKRLNYLLLSL